ncbi:MAG TPA: SRPBCC domain-containing protein [Dehalococcoidia bacterium]|jgi:uncharacterized protein YndB with AHSA1/START domain/DNA-binding transcriptional ArsR family regulator|nr:SRPBCC domain-containing protein [Dehalococcoidia bacterium]
MDGDLVFRALADPSRRRLLDLLFERDGRTLTELESGLTMTRFGVMKHLRLLEQAGLISTRKMGREKLHYLNPVPIRLIHDRWIDKYTASHAAALAALKTALEGATTMATETATEAMAQPKQVYQVFIKASPERIWEAITTPEFTALYFYGAQVESDLRVGSPFVYHTADRAAVMVDGDVLESDPPRRLVHTWRMLYNPELAAEPHSRVTWEIEPQEGGVSKLTVIHDGFERENSTFREVAGGWMLVLSGLKTLLETGRPLQAA